MTPADIQQLRDIIEDSVKTTVNGKIDHIRTLLDEHMKSDTEWKKNSQPAIDMWTNVNGFGKVIAYFFGILAGGGAFVTGIIELLKIIKVIK